MRANCLRTGAHRQGFRFVTVSSDARILAAGSQDILGAMRAK